MTPNKIYKSLIALFAGGLLPLAFAPFGYSPIAILCCALLLTLWLNDSVRDALRHGFIFGLGFFSVGISWVYISIHEFGNTIAPIALFITALFVAILACFPAMQGYVLARFFPRDTPTKLFFAFPASWVLIEWVRNWIFTGFPWLLLGASQTNSPLRSFAPIVGEPGLSFLVALTGALLVTLIINLPIAKKFGIEKNHMPLINKKIFYLSTIGILLIWGSTFLLKSIHWTKPASKPIQVSLIQGNIPQQLKWNPQYLETTLKSYYELTQQHWDSRIIIWPEAAIPLLQKDAQGFLNGLSKKAKAHKTTLITGIPIQENSRYYNGLLALGVDQGKYYKRHLVPFGEYLPWWTQWLKGIIGFLAIPMSDFSAGPVQQPMLHVAGIDIAAFICYEITYSDLVLKGLPQAQLLLTISNDAWFGDSLASAQHLQIGQLRALETGRYLIFTANDGITAIVNPEGHIQQQISRFQIDVLTGTVEAMNGITPWMVIGMLPFISVIFILFVLAGWRESVERKASNRV